MSSHVRLPHCGAEFSSQGAEFSGWWGRVPGAEFSGWWGRVLRGPSSSRGRVLRGRLLWIPVRMSDCHTVGPSSPAKGPSSPADGAEFSGWWGRVLRGPSSPRGRVLRGRLLRGADFSGYRSEWCWMNNSIMPPKSSVAMSVVKL